jgi:hypothetical protein
VSICSTAMPRIFAISATGAAKSRSGASTSSVQVNAQLTLG